MEILFNISLFLLIFYILGLVFFKTYQLTYKFIINLSWYLFAALSSLYVYYFTASFFITIIYIILAFITNYILMFIIVIIRTNIKYGFISIPFAWNIFLSKLPFIRYGTIDYQVRYYIKRYAMLLQTGLSIDESIRWLMEFYLQGETHDRRIFMEGKFNDYVSQIDQLIYDIMIFYFHYDAPEHYPIDDILLDTQHYLEIYKSKYRL